jgi:hypothetical protein
MIKFKKVVDKRNFILYGSKVNLNSGLICHMGPGLPKPDVIQEKSHGALTWDLSTPASERVYRS